MNKKMRFLTVTLMATMALTVGCNSKKDNTSNAQNEPPVQVEKEANDQANDQTDPGEEASEEEDKNVSTTPDAGLTLSYSKGLDDAGFYEGVTALDLVDLADYDALVIPASVHVISDERVDEGISNVMNNFMITNKITDRAVVDGDVVNIDFVGSVDGVEFSGGSTEGAGTDVTIGVTQYIDDFLDQLIGSQAGDIINVEVTFPEEYNQADLAGKDAVFVTTVNHIVETEKPELTDAFVAENFSEAYKTNTVAELKEDFRNNYRKDDINNYLFDLFLKDSTVDTAPDSVIVYQQMIAGNMVLEEAYINNLSVEEYLETQSDYTSLDEYIVASKGVFENKASTSLIIQALAEKYDVSVSEEDISAYFLRLRGDSDYSILEEKFGLSYIKKGILFEKIVDEMLKTAIFE